MRTLFGKMNGFILTKIMCQKSKDAILSVTCNELPLWVNKPHSCIVTILYLSLI